MGELRLEIPQVRGLRFYPKSLERGCRSEKALKLAIAEMYDRCNGADPDSRVWY